MHSGGQNQIANMPGFTPPPSHADGRPDLQPVTHAHRDRHSWARRGRVIGVGRVKTPTLAIVCKRELEIRNFVPLAYFEVVATAKVAGGQFQMRHAPQDRIVRREIAQEIADAARGFEGALAVRVEDTTAMTAPRHTRSEAGSRAFAARSSTRS